MTCKVHIHFYNHFPFLGEISWKPMSVFITAFSNVPLGQSLVWLVKVTYFTVTSCLTSFLEVVFSTRFIPLRTLSPFTPQTLCPDKSSLWSTISLEVFSRQSDLQVPETLPHRLTHFQGARTMWVKFKGVQGKWMRATVLTIRLMWIRIGRGSRALGDSLVFAHSLAMVHQVPVCIHSQSDNEGKIIGIGDKVNLVKAWLKSNCILTLH